MAHGGEQPRRPRDFAGRQLVAEQALEHGLRLGGDRGQPGGEVAFVRHVHGGIVSRCA